MALRRKGSAGGPSPNSQGLESGLFIESLMGVPKFGKRFLKRDSPRLAWSVR